MRTSMIKLLRLDKLIWGIFCLIGIIAEMIVIVPIVFLVFIYDFKSCPWKIWGATHSTNLDYRNKWGGYAYKDVTPWDTFKRRFKFIFNYKYEE